MFFAAIATSVAVSSAAAPSVESGSVSEPVVELLTMGAGELLWERFGHAALCISRGPDLDRARCYNFGSTNFDDVGGLAWGFVRGRPVFWVSTTTRKRMVAEYQRADRTVFTQRLDLSKEAAQRLQRTLKKNALPANRDYHYHHFRDNCASRLRDVLDDATGGALSQPPSRTIPASYRQLTRAGFAGDTAMLLVSDLILGRAADRQPSTFDAMFLPDVLRVEVEHRLGAKPEILHNREGGEFPRDPGLGARWIFALVALIFAGPFLWQRKTRPGRPRPWTVALALLPCLILAVLLWTLAVLSPLAELRFNENLLLFVPFDLVLVFGSARLSRMYSTARLIQLALVGLLAILGILVQPLWALLPMPVLVHALMLGSGDPPSGAMSTKVPTSAEPTP